MHIPTSASLLLLLGAFAQAAERQVIVSYPKDTPRDTVKHAEDLIVASGGSILYEYTIINGFAAKAPAEVLNTIQTTDTKDGVVIEDDQTVSVQGR